MRQPAPGTMTQEQASEFIHAMAAVFIREGFEPEVAVAKAGSELRRIRSENAVKVMANIKRKLGI